MNLIPTHREAHGTAGEKEEVVAQVHPVAKATEGVAHHRGGGEVAVAAVADNAVKS